MLPPFLATKLETPRNTFTAARFCGAKPRKNDSPQTGFAVRG
jgi:hypothetical protein